MASAIIACGVFTTAVTSCLEQTSIIADRESIKDKVLRFDVNAPFTSLFPADVKFSGSILVFPLLYSFLFVPGSHGELTPDLALEWMYDAERRQWTIHLRNDARFHDRQPVTAQDVKFSIETYITHIRPGLEAIIDRIIAASDTHVKLILKKDDPSILIKIWDIEIVPHQKNHPSNGQVTPIGSGPFQFSGREGHRRVTLEANRHYYGGSPALDRIELFYQTDREKSWTRLLSGQTDAVQEISPKNYQITKQYEDRFYLDTYTMRYYTILLYNTHDPLFSNPMVRRALTLGIDRNYIVQHILKGFGRIATGPMGEDSRFHAPGIQPLPFDPSKARNLLEQAGWRLDQDGRLHKQGRPFAFTLLVFQESQVEKKVARYVQLSLHRLGIQIHLQAMGLEEIKASYLQNTRFQAVVTELNGAYRRPESIKSIWSTGDHGPADAGCFNHPQVNRLIEKALSTADTVKKITIFHDLDRLMADLQPGTFLFQKTAIDAMSRRIHLPHRFSLTLEGIHRLRDASISEAFAR